VVYLQSLVAIQWIVKVAFNKIRAWINIHRYSQVLMEWADCLLWYQEREQLMLTLMILEDPKYNRTILDRALITVYMEIHLWVKSLCFKTQWVTETCLIWKKILIYMKEVNKQIKRNLNLKTMVWFQKMMYSNLTINFMQERWTTWSN
jgi:hypothetical protein